MADKIDKEHIIYFKDLLEGKSKVSVTAYLNLHEESLRKQLSRAQFLRIKFKPIDEIEAILKDENIEYKPNLNAIRTERYFRNFHRDVLDENGKLKSDFKNSLFNGAVGLFTENGPEAAKAALGKFLGLPDKINNKKAIEKLDDVEGLGEVELNFGNEELGLFLLKNIAGINEQFSPVDDIVLRAKEAIKNFELKSS